MNLISTAKKGICATLLFAGLGAFGFSEGVDYQRLATPLNVEKNSVVKVFSYSCSHCYKFDKGVTPKLFSKLEGVRFAPFHLKTMGAFGQTVSNILATMVYLDEKSGVSLLSDESKFKKAKFAIYAAQHDKNQKFADKNELIEYAIKSAGVSRMDFDAAASSRDVSELLALWDEGYEVAKISGVPSYVVAGKWLINNDAISSVDKMAQLVKELLKK